MDFLGAAFRLGKNNKDGLGRQHTDHCGADARSNIDVGKSSLKRPLPDGTAEESEVRVCRCGYYLFR